MHFNFSLIHTYVKYVINLQAKFDVILSVKNDSYY